VRLSPGRIYEVPSEIHVKPYVMLDCTGAEIRPSGDHNVFFLDNGAELLRPSIYTKEVSSYSSSAIVIDSGRAAKNSGITNNYRMFQWEAPVVKGAKLAGSNASGTGLHVRSRETADGGFAGPVALGTTIDANVTQFDVGMDAVVEGEKAFINGAKFELNINSCRIGIRHRGDGPFASLVSGFIQPSRKRSEYGILKEGGHKRSLAFFGQLWDPHAYQKQAVDADGIRIFNFLPLDVLKKHSEFGPNSAVFSMSLDGINTYETGGEGWP
jgi:hypothetical protein